MPIAIVCSACGVRLTVGDDRAGDLLECPKCDMMIRVPASASQPGQVRPVPPPLPPSGRSAPKPPPLPPVKPVPPLPRQPETLPPEDDEPEATVAEGGAVSRRAMLAAGGGALALAGVGLASWLIWRPRRSAEGTANAADNQPMSGEQVYQRLVRFSALIVTRAGIGSGFVVHTDKRLVVTNDHVVGRAKEVVVIFPLYGSKGELITDARKYESRIKEVGVKGEVIERDAARDLALIRLERLLPKTQAVSFAWKPAATGSAVYSVGNSGLILANASGADGNLLWRLTKGTVRGRVERQMEGIDCMILETDAPVNPGDSGGPVVNDRAELVAVVSHFITTQRQVSGNIDAEEVRKFLAPHLPHLSPS